MMMLLFLFLLMCPRPKTRPRKTKDLCAICESIWASDLQHGKLLARASGHQSSVPKILHFFWKGFRTRLFKTKICKIPQEWLFLQRKKSAFKRSYRVRGMGPPPGTRFCMYSYDTKQNKKAKTKKNTSFVWESYIK